MTESPPRAWAEINLSALKDNLRTACERSGKDVMAVIKGGAYGHGLEEVARALDSENLPYLGVANAGEARRLFHAGIKTRPYILGATLPAEREEIAAREWTPCLCSFEEIEHLNSLGQTNPVQAHLALDTAVLPGRRPVLRVIEGAHRDRRSCVAVVLESDRRSTLRTESSSGDF